MSERAWESWYNVQFLHSQQTAKYMNDRKTKPKIFYVYHIQREFGFCFTWTNNCIPEFIRPISKCFYNKCYTSILCFHQQWQPFCENLIGLIFSELFFRAVFMLDFSGSEDHFTSSSFSPSLYDRRKSFEWSQSLSSPLHESNLASLSSRTMKNIFCIITKEALLSNGWMRTDIFVYNIFWRNNGRSSVGQIEFMNPEL